MTRGHAAAAVTALIMLTGGLAYPVYASKTSSAHRTAQQKKAKASAQTGASVSLSSPYSETSYREKADPSLLAFGRAAGLPEDDLPLHPEPYPMQMQQFVPSGADAETVVCDGSVWSSEGSDIMLYWHRVPAPVLAAFRASGGKLVLTYDLGSSAGKAYADINGPAVSASGKQYPGFSYMGAFVGGNIYSDWTWWYGHKTCLHELGHWADTALGNVSSSQVWADLMKRYGQQSAHETDSPREFFAETFAKVLSEPLRYAAEYPDEYAAVAQACADFQKQVPAD